MMAANAVTEARRPVESVMPFMTALDIELRSALKAIEASDNMAAKAAMRAQARIRAMAASI